MEDILFRISASDWAEIVRNYAFAVSGIVAGIVAFDGLRTWKNRLVWKEDRELAREILMHVHRIEKRIIENRDFVTRDLFYMEHSERVQHSPTPDEELNREMAYSSHLDHQFQESRSSLEPILSQARALWGRSFTEAVEKLLEIERKQILDFIKFSYLSERKRNQLAGELTGEFFHKLNSLEDSLFSENQDDDFQKIVSKLVANIESKYRTKVGRNS